jgi:co-chaperonin GroES (HSP10)
MVMTHENDPKELLKKEIGDLSQIEIFNTQILCAVYIRPQKTKSGLYLPDSTVAEDQHQSKVGLVVKMGADAFIDDTGKWFKDGKIELDDWVVFRPSDGWSITVNGVLCRILDDTNVRGRIQQPDQVW